MESKLRTRETQKTYPALYAVGHLVILMTEEKKGMVVHSNALYLVGDYRDDWIMDELTPFHGIVELSN